MTSERSKQEKKEEIEIIEINLEALRSEPDYLKAPLEEITRWVEAVFPKGLQGEIMKFIKDMRGKQNTE